MKKQSNLFMHVYFIPFLKYIFFITLIIQVLGCKQKSKEGISDTVVSQIIDLQYARGFSLKKTSEGVTFIHINSPWPNATSTYTYALIPKDKIATITVNKDDFDAIVATPVASIVVTSTTHIPALEALGVLGKLTGFPDTKYVSSKKARDYIELGHIKDIGSNETLNTELTIALQPDVLVGFGVDGQNPAYETLKRSNIPVVYNGDWTETTPLGKAEWIKFFAPFFQKEVEADTIFSNIEASYVKVKKMASAATEKPTVMSGALFKDVWYLPGGNSWAAQFLKDANADYLWKDNTETGSLSLSWEHVLQKAKDADYWISPAQFTSYEGMTKASAHYVQFDPFINKQVYTFSNTLGNTGGVLYYELAPQRPDLVLRDLVHILHPELLPEHEPYFFNPLQ